MNVIQIENLWKEYRLGVIGHGTLTKDLQSWWAKIFGKEDPNSSIAPMMKGQEKQIKGDRFWALQDINLEVKEGDLLGIIGKNGAGKSTLLKILSRVTAPSQGRVKIKGRISSLLEVGTGFHPELTGRENVYLNGAILGMSKREITGKFDEIVDFSGIEKFIDTPVKRYSSGMYVRLAFAVAAHLEPEILIIDEVLAVGDADFQKKCLGKMKNVSSLGRTVLFVSHNMPMITALCEKSLLMSGGRIEMIGNTTDVVLNYLKVSRVDSSSVDYSENKPSVGDDVVKLHAAKIINESGVSKSEIDIRESFKIVMEYELLQEKSVVSNFHFKTMDDVYVMVVHDESAPSSIGKYRAECLVPKYLLNDGAYTVGVAVSSFEKGTHVHFFEQNALTFNVKDPIAETRTGYSGRIPGIIRPQLKWEMSRLS